MVSYICLIKKKISDEYIVTSLAQFMEAGILRCQIKDGGEKKKSENKREVDKKE